MICFRLLLNNNITVIYTFSPLKTQLVGVPCWYLRQYLTVNIKGQQIQLKQLRFSGSPASEAFHQECSESRSRQRGSTQWGWPGQRWRAQQSDNAGTRTTDARGGFMTLPALLLCTLVLLGKVIALRKTCLTYMIINCFNCYFREKRKKTVS